MFFQRRKKIGIIGCVRVKDNYDSNSNGKYHYKIKGYKELSLTRNKKVKTGFSLCHIEF